MLHTARITSGRVMISGKDIAGAAHIGGKLIHLVDAVEHLAREDRIAQIAAKKLIGRGRAKFVLFDIDAAHPKPLGAQPLDQVAADEAACPVNQNSFHNAASSNSLANDITPPATAPAPS